MAEATGIKYVVVDGMNLAHKSYHKFKEFSISPEPGKVVSTGLVFGFLRTLHNLATSYPGALICILWDNASGWRRVTNAEYKTNRPALYDDFRYQLSNLDDILRHLGVAILRKEGYEADDLAAVFSKLGNSLLVTTDMDWAQLVNDLHNVMMYSILPKNINIFDEAGVKENFGVKPKAIPLFKALRGDKSDNIAGIRRFPTKLAAELAETWLSPGHLFAHYSWDVSGDKWGQEILKNGKLVADNYNLCTLHPPECYLNEFVRFTVFEREEADYYFRKYQFSSFLKDPNWLDCFKNQSVHLMEGR